MKQIGEHETLKLSFHFHSRLVEKNTDAFLDNQEKNKKKQEEVDETVNNC